jgi:hypothetical protein
METIVETVILFLFEYPGAMIRWALLRGKRPFKEILYDDSFPNWLLTVIVIALTVCLFKAL